MASTGSVTLTALWIHDATDLDTYMTVGVRSFSEARRYEGSTAALAGGRLRSITGPGSQKAYKVGLKFVSRATITSLETYMNIPVMVRDQTGRKLFGLITEVDIDEEMLAGTQTSIPVGGVSFTLEEITMTEEV